MTGADPGRRLLIGGALVLSALFLMAPVLYIFVVAFSRGWEVYAANILHPATLHAVYLTVLTAIVCVPINVAFGIAVAWAVSRYDFWGRRLLISMIEIPFSVSPIVAGVVYLFLYGQRVGLRQRRIHVFGRRREPGADGKAAASAPQPGAPAHGSVVPGASLRGGGGA